MYINSWRKGVRRLEAGSFSVMSSEALTEIHEMSSEHQEDFITVVVTDH